MEYWKVYLWHLFLTVLYFSCQPLYLNRAVGEMGAVRKEAQENSMEGMAVSVSPLYLGWTKGQERLVELNAGVAESRALRGGWGGAASDSLLCGDYRCGILCHFNKICKLQAG